MKALFYQSITCIWNLPWYTITFSEWIQIIISIVSFIVTIILTIVIFKIQRRHERTIEEMEQRRRQDELVNKADRFIIDHEKDIGYLPWCVFASNLHRHGKHSNKIYTDFCRCSDDLQNEILKQANYNFEIITDSTWTEKAFDALKIDIENHQLGRDVLYDREKYFVDAYRDYNNLEWHNLNYLELFEPIAFNLGISSFFKKTMYSLGDYIYEYFEFRYSEYEPKIYNPRPKPPIDYLCDVINFGRAEKPIVCAWVVQLVKEICLTIRGSRYVQKKAKLEELYSIDIEPKTYEDAYYDALMELYNTYCCIELAD